MAAMPVREASSASSGCVYHVFLNFRGKDTRKTFTDHLQTALENAGFRTFKDDDGMDRGENINSELQKAIKQSRSSIIIFSKDYASSRWCLDELVTILERKRTSGQIVLPVFYDVDPTQVRKQTGSFAEAFARHEGRFKKETTGSKTEWMDRIKGWRAALREAADIGGMVLKNEADGHEAKFIKKIVQVIEDKLNRPILNIGPYLIGMHTRVKNINIWLQDGSSNVGIVAICGMGGIGKTTVAKFVYNLHFQKFEGRSFLAVREILEQTNGLVRLQRKLLSDLLKGKTEKIGSVDEGIVKIKEVISSKRVLVVLDDVYQVEQIDALLGMRDWFSPGSKIIITTRHEWLLKAHEIYMVHSVERLNDDESFKLFNLHAFGQDHPIKGYMEHSKRVVHYCGGLPLALQVVGSSLSGKSVDLWKSALAKLEAIPDSRILEKLKISFDSLQDDHDQNLFLHIACFFVGKDKSCTVTILDECNFYTAIGIQNLVDRCVLTIDESNKLRMHQLLRDMGREIIRQESPKDPGKRSRLWRHNDSITVLREKTGSATIEGLALDMHMFKEGKPARTIFTSDSAREHCLEEERDKLLFSNEVNPPKRHRSFFSGKPTDTVLRNEVDLEIDSFTKMPNLSLLQLNDVHFNDNECYDAFPKRLRWLCWRGFPLKYIPGNFPLESLVSLEMRYSNLKQVWEETKFLVLLKILDLSHCRSLAKTPDFSVILNLERLILKDCASLVEIHESIGNLKRLVLLNLKDCKNLQRLPRNIIMLTFLETLIISGCSDLNKLPAELRKMESLKVLHADGIAINRLLPSDGEVGSWLAFVSSYVSKPRTSPKNSWASLPSSLVSLSLANCRLSDEDFPMEFTTLSSLQHLNLSQNPLFSLPDCIRGLSRLQTLRLESCKRLQLLEGLPSVKKLDVSSCTSLEKITYMSTLSKPLETAVYQCENLVEVQEWFKLEPIERFDPEIINVLGLHNFESMADFEVTFANCMFGVYYTKICPIQGLYEHGIFSTYFPGREVPDWFSHKSIRNSISFTVPSLPNVRIQGLNVCSVYTLYGNEENWNGNIFYNPDSQLPHPLFTKIHNKTKDLKWIYGPMCFGIPEVDEDMILLSHWKLGSQLEGGDEMTVSIVMDGGFKVKGCGINLVYEQEDNTCTQSDSVNPCGLHVNVIGGDLLPYQVKTGVYFLCDYAEPTVYDSSSSSLGWFDLLCQDSDETTDGEEENGETSEIDRDRLSCRLMKVLFLVAGLFFSVALVSRSSASYRKKRKAREAMHP